MSLTQGETHTCILLHSSELLIVDLSSLLGRLLNANFAQVENLRDSSADALLKNNFYRGFRFLLAKTTVKNVL